MMFDAELHHVQTRQSDGFRLSMIARRFLPLFYIVLLAAPFRSLGQVPSAAAPVARHDSPAGG
jgi:hypothetical protein